MQTRRGVLAVITATFLATAGAPASAQQTTPPDAIAGYETELLAPGIWRVADDGADNPLGGFMHEIRVGPDGSVWILSDGGVFKLGMSGAGPKKPRVDRLFAVDDDGNAWLRYVRANRQGFGTWDGESWTDRSGKRRKSARRPDPTRAPGVIRDFALGADGTVWVVAGEQDGPRWQRFTIERLDRDGWTTWAIGEGLPELRCGKNCGDDSRVVTTDDGTVWISVDQGGLLRYDGNEWEVVRPLGDDTDRPVRTLVGDSAGFIWAELTDRREDADGFVSARFDGAEWHAPESAEADGASLDAESLEGPLARAVGPDGTLWAAGPSEAGPQVLRAIDDQERRVVPDLGLCPVAEGDSETQPAEAELRVRRCGHVTSLAVAPDGIVWALASLPSRDAGGKIEGVLLVIDPEAVFDA